MNEYSGVVSKINSKKERDSILQFLHNYWTIQIKSKSDTSTLTTIVDYVLEEGIKYGIAYQEKQLLSTIEKYNLIARAMDPDNKNNWQINFNITTKEKDFDFGHKISYIEKIIKKDASINAVPKDYTTFKATHSLDDLSNIVLEKPKFNGAKLDDSILAVCTDFATTLSIKEIYFYEKEQNRSPLSSLIGAILRQGMTIGYDLVDQKWGSKSEYTDKMYSMFNK
ncbi:MAG: hypothetical protein ACP5N1_02700 [Candidatus Woesearchaeota archaeon]